MRALEIFILLLLLVALGMGLYVFWIYAGPLYLPQKVITYKPSLETTVPPPSLQQVQFYPRMRYKDKEISYAFDSACTEEKKQDVLRAFGILSQLSVLRFYPTSSQGSKPEIEIACSALAPTAEQKSHFVAGEGGPSTVINASNYYVILAGKISLFRKEVCDQPNIALHEILHALGFDHNQNTKSILYPVTSCEQEIDSYIIEALASLYRDPSLPDIAITEVSGTGKGRYLSFSVDIANVGLRDAQYVNISILTQGKIVQTFSLDDIGIGIRKSFRVDNLFLPRSTQNITFHAYTADGSNELSLKNNYAELEVASTE